MKTPPLTGAARAQRSRQLRMKAGPSVRVDIILTDPKVVAKLEKLAGIHGTRRDAIIAAILAM